MSPHYAPDEITGRAVLVHAKDEAVAAFYQKWGFHALPQNPHHLHLLMKDLRASTQRSHE